MHFTTQLSEDLKKICAKNFNEERTKKRISQDEEKNKELIYHLGNALTTIEMNVKNDIKKYLAGESIDVIAPPELEQKIKKLFESGSTLHRDYNGHLQMFMNEGTFMHILKEELQKESIAFNDWVHNNGWELRFDNKYIICHSNILPLTSEELYKQFKTETGK